MVKIPIHGRFKECQIHIHRYSWLFEFISTDLNKNSYELYDYYEPRFFMSCMTFKLCNFYDNSAIVSEAYCFNSSKMTDANVIRC